MIFRTPAERGEQREFLARQGKRTICDKCIRGHKEPCDYEECCCICNESHTVKEVPVNERQGLRQTQRYERNMKIRELRSQGEKIITLAARFNLAQNTIGYIVRGRHDG